MRILIASDKFKGCMTSMAAAKAIEAAARRALPRAQLTAIPMADGGEGTIEAFLAARSGGVRVSSVTGPYGHPVAARWAVLSAEPTAVIEMAAASGLHLARERNPLCATTAGVGELIVAALDQGCRRIYVGLGGSATVDIGLGMARSLGVGFYDDAGSEIATPERLDRLARIDLSNRDPRLADTEVIGLCDVSSPLLEGLLTFAPQKGAGSEDLARIEQYARRVADLTQRQCQRDIAELPGGGAAGGLGAGLAVFAGARLMPGAAFLLNLLGFEEEVRTADLVITGEGRLDATSRAGKVVGAILDLARKHGKPAIAFVGSYSPSIARELGLTAVYSIASDDIPLAERIRRGPSYLEQTAARVFQSLPIP